jgi:hypothetical protein
MEEMEKGSHGLSDGTCLELMWKDQGKIQEQLLGVSQIQVYNTAATSAI